MPAGYGTIKGDEPYLNFYYPDETLGYFYLLPRVFQETTLIVHLRPRPGVSIQLMSASLQFSVCDSQSWQDIQIPDFPVDQNSEVPPTSVLEGFQRDEINPKDAEMGLWSYSAQIRLPGAPECFEIRMPDMIANGQKLSFGTVRFSRIEKSFVEVMGIGL
ncbi:MAG: hypothetical protein KIS79_15345 [Burkholderiales bacterium]|nr:hypothetical protein [Burkholderiales bacterium]